MGKKIDPNFFLHEDVVLLSRQLLGKRLLTSIDGVVRGGVIIETESYKGPEDKASHAYQNRRTQRTQVLFQKGGVAYVYICYGIHTLLNFVTHREGIPHGILIRGIKPDLLPHHERHLLNKRIEGPGLVTRVLHIDKTFYGESLTGSRLWVEEGEPPSTIQQTTRVGIDYAEEDALLPWRFIAS